MTRPRPLFAAVRDDDRVPGPLRFLLLILATYADREGECWPSLETLARDLGRDERTARRQLRKAEALGLLTRTREPKGRRRLNHYRLRVGAWGDPTYRTSVSGSPTPTYRTSVSGRLPDISPLTTGHFGPLLPDTGDRSTGRVKEESKEEGAAGGDRDTPPPAPGDIEEARRLLADPASPEYVRRAAQKALDRADGPTSSTGDRVGDNGTRPAGEVPEVIDYGEDLEAFKASFRTPDTEPEEEEQTP